MFSRRDRSLRHDTCWSQASSPPALQADHVHIWKVRLDGPAIANSEESFFSSDETARAGRFHFERDRGRFIRCRSALRRLLGEYLALPAPSIRIKYLTNGKPQVDAEQNPRSLQFNVSHSAELALIAVGAIGNEKQLGVDIEKIRGDVATNLLSERFFSSLEREGLRWLPEHLRVPGFFACWTRKEALLKETGDGLFVPLAVFFFTTHPGRFPGVV